MSIELEDRDWLRDAAELVESKEKVYVDSPAEVPQGAQMREGDRGGLFYNTEDVEAFQEAMVNMLENVVNHFNFEDEQVDEAEELYDEYDANASEHYQDLASATQQHIDGGQFRVKSEASMLEKVHGRDNEYESIEDLNDIFGAMLFAESPEAIEDVVDAVTDDFNVVDVDDYRDNDGYYRAVHMDIEFGDGQTGEVQVKTQEMAQIIDVGHKVVYKDETDLDIDGEDRDLVEDCLTQQMDFVMNNDEPDCDDRAVEIIQEVQS